jgi:hypothetical protein
MPPRAAFQTPYAESTLIFEVAMKPVNKFTPAFVAKSFETSSETSVNGRT